MATGCEAPWGLSSSRVLRTGHSALGVVHPHAGSEWQQPLERQMLAEGETTGCLDQADILDVRAQSEGLSPWAVEVQLSLDRCMEDGL